MSEINGNISAVEQITGNLYPKGEKGNGIDRIERISRVGLVDTYSIYFTDGTSKTFTVTNGEKGDTGDTGPKGDPGDVSLEQLNTAVGNATKTTQTTEVSEQLTINNCAGVKGKLDIKSGKTEQATREGYNKLPNNITTQNINGVDFIVNKDRTILVNGTATANALLQLNTGITYSAGKYRLSGCPKGGATDTYRFDLMNKANNNIPIIDIGNGAEFTLTEETTFIPRIRIQGGVTINNLLFKPMLVSDTSKTIYEPYGASPSPDYPSRIRNVGDNINLFDKNTIIKTGKYHMDGTEQTNSKYFYNKVRVKGINKLSYNGCKNSSGSNIVIFDFYDNNDTFISCAWYKTTSDIVSVPDNATYCYFSYLYSEIDTIKIEEGSVPTGYSEYGCGSIGVRTTSGNIFNKDTDIELDGQFRNYNTGNIATSTGYCGIKKKVKPNTIYISTYIQAGNFSNLCFFDKNMNYISGLIYNTENTEFITPNNCEYITLAIYKPVINQYELKEVQEKIFPLAEGQVLHKGDYLASDGIHHKRKTLVLTGTENWVKSSSREGSYYVRWENLTNKGKTFSKFICNYAECVDNINEYVVEKAFSDGSLNLWFDNGSMINTVDLWKSYLAEQYANGTPVTVEYELAEEIVIPYTAEQEQAYYELQHLLMYEGYTQITCIDEIKPDIQGTYYFNNELNNSYGERFDKVEDSINELENKHIYSTEEKVVGRWIDGKPLYSKVIDIGELPNATTKNVAFNISNLKNIIKMEGYARGPSYWLPIPYSNNIIIMCNSSVIGITTTGDRSNCTGYVTLYYTKTTD